MLSIHGPSILVASFNYTVSHSHYVLRTPFLLHKICVTPTPPQWLPLTTCYHLHSIVGDPRSDSYCRRVYMLAVGFRRCLRPSSSFPLTHKSRTFSYPILLIKPSQIWVVTFSIILFFSLNLYFKIFTIQNKMNKSL